ncbi:MAG TPA: sigma-70 family RNA polymerase sigma factor [Solirubrobacteraceae bacterium]|nr:sigma-70 family RNA polymerase sigma factor [Solirubrobacteraceae bacterium]
MSRPGPSSDEHAPRAVAAAAAPGALSAEVFAALFRECGADVHGYAISLLGDRSAAEDVTALAFERLYRSRSRLDHRRGTPRAWLFAIARNAALDELRRRRRQPRYELEDELAADRDCLEALEHVERRATVRAALAALPLREREVVLLKFHGQLSNSELARALGISESNAGTRLHRALTRLREGCLQAERQEEIA